MESLNEKQRLLAEAQAKLEELNRVLERLQKDYEEKVAQKEELDRKVIFYCISNTLQKRMTSLSV